MNQNPHPLTNSADCRLFAFVEQRHKTFEIVTETKLRPRIGMNWAERANLHSTRRKYCPHLLRCRQSSQPCDKESEGVSHIMISSTPRTTAIRFECNKPRYSPRQSQPEDPDPDLDPDPRDRWASCYLLVHAWVDNDPLRRRASSSNN
ncbi:hypothetical protein VFPPC_15372 [Pochonia chlamydosporia 170]|uniref:Uncharacterized protein n=1 Tax=Pochonia chlamydosporia 170 TaxID=1380566 RepID=A0A179G7U1_METCM|nr:hypothetical protein VFPPC_15372 [Pochonia chlamydosporia 170]OAQ73862.1 hypothetical protein VFPPC_15372 [Pochonia chlamydosporia 170]